MGALQTFGPHSIVINSLAGLELTMAYIVCVKLCLYCYDSALIYLQSLLHCPGMMFILSVLGSGDNQHQIGRFERGAPADCQHPDQAKGRLPVKNTGQHTYAGCLLHWHRQATAEICWPNHISEQHSIIRTSSFTLGCIDLLIFSSVFAGDLLTALLLARLHKNPDNMQHAVEQAVASLQAVLVASAEASGEAAHATERTAEV